MNNLNELSEMIQEFLEQADVKTWRRLKNTAKEMEGNAYLDALLYQGKHHVVFQGNVAIFEYLNCLAIDAHSTEEEIASMESIVRRISDGYLEPLGSGITADTVDRLMGLVDQRFGLSDLFFAERPISILILPHSHKSCSSECNTRIYDNHTLVCDIFMYHMGKSGFYPESIFLHEIGHVVHTHITGQPAKLPEGFMEMFTALFDNKGKALLNESMEREYFADCFAMAALVEANMDEFDSYTVVPKTSRLKMLDYMMGLFQQYRAQIK